MSPGVRRYHLHQDDWHDQAVCRGKGLTPVDWWFSEEGSAGGVTPAQRKALRLCFTCPVRRECLEHSLNKPERDGIWGGSTAAQRRQPISDLLKQRVSPEKALEQMMMKTESEAMKLAITPRRRSVKPGLVQALDYIQEENPS